jgi:hypothetical protein
MLVVLLSRSGPAKVERPSLFYPATQYAERQTNAERRDLSSMLRVIPASLRIKGQQALSF